VADPPTTPRAALVRAEIGPARHLMVDANQVWDVPQAIAWMRDLARFDPWWVEEPTSPDDVLGHAAIAAAVAPIRVATGEHWRTVLFKQFLQAGALQVCQLDACRLAGVNECLAVLLLAAKFNVPVCPHAGGVGLCEHVQHLSAFDAIAVGGPRDDRVVEYVDHLHEHFVDPVRSGAASTCCRIGRVTAPRFGPNQRTLSLPRRARLGDGGGGGGCVTFSRSAARAGPPVDDRQQRGQFARRAGSNLTWVGG
jgi:hypothetical protein